SVEAMEAARVWFNALWRNPLGTALLYGSLLVHFALALLALFRRHTLRMPMREAAQLALGLPLPFLLVAHVVGTRIDFAVTGWEAGYPDVLRGLWVLNPFNGAKQALALVIAWLHGCLGIYFWLRPKPGFQRYAVPLYTAALLVPVLALLGFAQAGQEIAARPEGQVRSVAASDMERLSDIRLSLYAGFAFLIAGVFALRGIRLLGTWSSRVRITYPEDRVVAVPRGFSLLEASRLAGIPHQSVCGGRGRCSTCRVVITAGFKGQPGPTPQERTTLMRIKAGPNVRLACQFRPQHDLSVVPVLPGRSRSAAGPQSPGIRGHEREIAVLFCDLRGFTRFAEHRLPFDTVFMLNRYFETVGHAVEEAGGHLDKFIGDGALALFGLSTPPEDASRQAILAALGIARGIEDLNLTYASELEQPMQVAMGLHVGPAIVGEMGYGRAVGLTAVGDTINTASRLEGLAKELDAELVLSAELANRAGFDLAGHELQTLTMRGRVAPLDAWIISSADRIHGLTRASSVA
ncbi:MAG TPA: adenylate/guanylate cyclase domain-containing protein, partial [Enterovirga sp.]|nr:adenylate/guanylate cyclase domain-containing protein [Enterovirga sp.]